MLFRSYWVLGVEPGKNPLISPVKEQRGGDNLETTCSVTEHLFFLFFIALKKLIFSYTTTIIYIFKMPYNEEFRIQVLQSVANLQGIGQLYNRRRHNLEQVLQTYKAKMNEKHAMLGSVILERMATYINHIFTNVGCETPFEVLDFINAVIKWYFKSLIKRRDKITLAVVAVPLPDYTIPEIKELYESMLA